jgi:hypothetical protein
MGIPIEVPSCVYGDNLSVIHNTQRPKSMLKKKSNSVCYHYCKESVAMGECITGDVPTKKNPADLCTKVIPGGAQRDYLGMQTMYDITVGFLCLINLAPSLVASSLYNTTRISNQSSVNLNFIQRVSTCFLFHLLAISAQLTVHLLTTGILYLSSVLSRAGMRACLSDAGKTVRDWGNLSF